MIMLNVASSSNPAAGRNGQAARDLSERMDAILKPETMAGSPDADVLSASRNLAHGFLFCGVSSFVKLMKEDRNVQ
jgi:hypothetical protein